MIDVSGIARLPEVIQATGLSRSTLYRMCDEGRFPPKIRLGLRAVGWPREAVLKWCADRPSAAPDEVA
jgi:prophage regulatory protein